MWELKVRITMLSEVNGEWDNEETIADLKVKINHTATDETGEYLPDDEITHDEVAEAVGEWQKRTGLVDDETTMIQRYYDPEKAKKCR